MFCATVAGAKAACGLYSIVETARANGLDASRYLEWLLTEIPAMRRQRQVAPGCYDYERLLP